MAYHDLLQQDDPEALELAYRAAAQKDDAGTFARVLEEAYRQHPENLLLAAWHYRLQHGAAVVKKRVIAWIWALPLALLNGLVFWWLSDFDKYKLKMPEQNYGDYPIFILYWSLITLFFVISYLSAAGGRARQRAAGLLATLAMVGVYVFWRYPHLAGVIPPQQYISLATLHLPVLAVAAVGFYLLRGRGSADDIFSFLFKLFETVMLAGLFALVVGLFSALTAALFAAIDIHLSDLVMRLLFVGGAGLIPVLATAITYHPTRAPAQQVFDEGMGKVIPLLTRLLLFLSLIVLTIYLGFIPFNFRAAFQVREILITYNATLFAVMLLLLGVTPVTADPLSPKQQQWLRRGIMAVSVLAALVGLYALIAIGYRTWRGILTPNRFAFLGWSALNMGLMAWLVIKQAQASFARWIPVMKAFFAAAAKLYALWALIVVLLTPWIFMHQDADFAALPVSVQRRIYGGDDPILLKCYESPHIYLLVHGKKRWVKDIATFEAQGFKWSDVRFVNCYDLRALPDGEPIPPDAGPPPVPSGGIGPVPTATLAPTPISTPAPD